VSEKTDKDKRLVFGLSKGEDGIPIMVIGIPEVAWDDHLRKAKTYTFDLTNVGIQLKLALFGGPNRAKILDTLQVFQKGGPLLDEKTDFGIPESERAIVRMREGARKYLMARASISWDNQDLDALVNAVLHAADAETDRGG